MTGTNGATGRSPVAVVSACAVAATAVLLTGCGEANGSTEWAEPDDYRYTLRMFEGKCGEKGKTERSWTITVADGAVRRAEPLNEAARTSSWAEGAPTIGELHSNALGVRKDGAYDIVDIDYVDEGTSADRPSRIYFLDRNEKYGDYESCNAIEDFRPAD
jgi:hypothetical protein